MNLNEDMIKELIPVIGKRVKFLKFWKQHYEHSVLEEITNANDNSISSKKRVSMFHMQIYGL